MKSTAIQSTSIAIDGDAPVDGASAPSAGESTSADTTIDLGDIAIAGASTNDTIGVLSQADSGLISLDLFRADPRFAGIDGRGVSVVVIDTGIDLNHPFFGPDANHNNVADRIVYSYDFSGSNDSDASDVNGHGSNVASIIGSQDATYTGMAPGVNIIALKVFPDSGSANNNDIAEALNWVVANRSAYNIVAVNMSLGVTGSNSNSYVSSPYASQFASLAAAGTAVVVAAGNSYAPGVVQSQGVSSPASDPNAWAVGAVWDRNVGGSLGWANGPNGTLGSIDYTTGADQIISFSQRSSSMNMIFAPGGQIVGANATGGTITESGTSQAAPHIAGLVADMQQLALQVSGHFLSVGQLKADMLAGAATIYDGDNENDNVVNTYTYYKRVNALGWGIAVLNDLFAGTVNNDTLNGTSVADTIHGSSGNDTLYGNGGDDMLYGDAGIDNLDGGAGNDWLSGDVGVDVLTGGTGSDTFFFAPGCGTDTVTDFSHAQGDRLDVLNILNVHSLSDIASRATQSGANAVIDFGAGDTLTLSNVTKSSLAAGDFAFSTLVEGYGAYGLDIVGSSYVIFALNSSSGRYLGYQGNFVSLNQFAGWTAIGAEYVSGVGYEVAWKSGSGYWLWTTDSNGMFQSGTMYSGSDLNFINQETTFQQDLNGDGQIGLRPTEIESAGATSLMQVGFNYYLYPVGAIGSLSGQALSSGGALMVVGGAGGWAPIGAEQSGGGYKVVWKMAGADQYTVWTTNSSGAYIANTAVVSGSDAGLQALETSFQQDLNGDGRIGPPPPPPPTVIEALGSTSLVQVGSNYFLYPVGGSSGPALSSGSALMVVGGAGGWAPIGAEASGGGYKVVWKMAGSDQYTIWTTNSSGAYLSNTAVVSGSGAGLQALETSFQQDLNGDSRIGPPPPPPPTVIEALGSTSLVTVGSNYYLYPSGGSSGPALSSGGALMVVGGAGGWAPIGAEASGGGYKVVWKMAGMDQYTIWTTNSSGAYLSNTAVVSGSDAGLQALETSFQQDLNGDSRIGPPPPPPPTVIEALGSTSLVTVGSNYFLYPSGGSSGPALSSGGALMMVGGAGGWAPIGAEASGSGYKVVWKMAGADQYTVWTTDSNGAYLSNTAVVSGSDSNLQSLETSFQQDLNGDSRIGPPPPPPPTVIEQAGSTSLVQVGFNYFLYPHGGSSGPALSSGGALMVAGQIGGWAPIGAEQLGSGYTVAWKMAGADQYTVWTASLSGAYISNTPIVSGSDPSIKGLEANLQQDLNGDGTIGFGYVGGTGSGSDGGVGAALPPPPPPVGAASVGDEATATLTLLMNYMASAFAPTAAAGPVAGAQTLTAEDFLTKPLA